MKIDLAERISKLPPYLFAELDRQKQKAIEKGMDIIDLGIGDPDLPSPKSVISALKQAVDEPANHRYPSYTGMLKFREAVSSWYKSRFGINLDPETEVITLIGSKEGIGHIPFAFINTGDIVIVPEPAYPVYRASTILAGGIPYKVPLLAENDFLPEFNNIPKDILNKTKLMFLNYPNNPTAATAQIDFFNYIVEFAHKHNIIICHDAAYTEIAFDGYTPPSLLQAEGAKDIAIEFHSLSKTFSMTGWRIGFAVGNKDIIAGLAKIKSNIDSGVFQAIQYAGIEALTHCGEYIIQMRKTYEERRNILIEGLSQIGFTVKKPQATFYLWLPVPDGETSMSFSSLLLNKCGIVTTPGSGFGAAGEGFIRMALTLNKNQLKEVTNRIKNIM